MLSPRQVSELLTIREFTQLCGLLDADQGKVVPGGQQIGAWGLSPTQFQVGDHRRAARFLVLGVLRDEKVLAVEVTTAASESVIVKLWERAATKDAA